MTIALILEKFLQPQRRGRNIRAAQEEILKESICYKIHCKACLRADCGEILAAQPNKKQRKQELGIFFCQTSQLTKRITVQNDSALTFEKFLDERRQSSTGRILEKSARSQAHYKTIAL